MRIEEIDFLIIGAAKCATTWLQRSLQQSPFVYMPDSELHYFSREYKRGDQWYVSQFKTASGRGVLIGEKSNSYLDDPKCAGRIYNAIPAVRMIVQMRNPVARAYSDYCMLYRRGEVNGDIEAYLDPENGGKGRFLLGGMYFKHIRRYIEYFGRESILLLLFEDMLENPTEHVKKAASHIGLEEGGVTPISRKIKDKNAPVIHPMLKRNLAFLKPMVSLFKHTSAYERVRSKIAREVDYPELNIELKRKMEEYYRRDTEELGRLMGRNLEGWLRT